MGDLLGGGGGGGVPLCWLGLVKGRLIINSTV